MLPRLTSLLLSVFAVNPMSQVTFFCAIGAPCTPTSIPLLSTLPALMNGFSVKASDGARGFRSNRSDVFLSKYVSSTPTRSWKKPASNPASNSVPRSGLRFGFPGLA